RNASNSSRCLKHFAARLASAGTDCNRKDTLAEGTDQTAVFQTVPPRFQHDFGSKCHKLTQGRMIVSKLGLAAVLV
ncbi:hypothetical protein Q5N78_19125, partial [Acinetobacter baumannii]|nr:hypothetical protein [Acinetobacter baumannii]